MNHLVDALVRYVEALEASAGSTHQAEDRSKYTAHLAAAAGMFRALHRGSLQDLKALVEQERHGFGCSYTSGAAGDAAETAFDEFAGQVEAA